jgi:hypothetical protein
MINEAQLLALKKQVDEAKSTVSELTGQRKALLKQLKDDYGFDNIEKANAELTKIKNEIASIDLQISDGIRELETKYNIG